MESFEWTVCNLRDRRDRDYLTILATPLFLPPKYAIVCGDNRDFARSKNHKQVYICLELTDLIIVRSAQSCLYKYILIYNFVERI